MKKQLLRKFEQHLPQDEPIINHYKRHDVFVCTHESHSRFKDTVSVYHVLKEKQCFPDGCLNFLWRCKRFEKGLACKRKFKHVGKNCSNCKFFYDIKVIKKPKLLLSEEQFKRFEFDLKKFEDWADVNRKRFTEFLGTINSVKPHFILKTVSDKNRVHFQGFLLNFSRGYFGSALFDDFVYMTISSGMQKKFCFAKGDVLSCFCNVSFKNGSMVLKNIRDIDILERGEPCFWNESRGRAAQRTGSVLQIQSEKCYECDRGSLVSIEHEDCETTRHRRVMYCFNGYVNPDFCCYRLSKTLLAKD